MAPIAAASQRHVRDRAAAPAAPHEPERPRVLVVDDDARITEVVALTLEDEGFSVEAATDGRSGLDVASARRPDVAVVDIMLPDMDGHAVLNALRRDRVPVIFLTAKATVAERRHGLDLGADDYVVKPFHPDELAARVRAVLRRSGAPASADTLRLGDLEIDLERRMLVRGGQPIPLSRIEWLLLQHLARNLGKVVLHGDLLRYVWGPSYTEDVQVLRVCISRLRAKLGSPSGRRGYIRTYVGVGYALQPEADADSANRRRRKRRRAAE